MVNSRSRGLTAYLPSSGRENHLGFIESTPWQHGRTSTMRSCSRAVVRLSLLIQYELHTFSRVVLQSESTTRPLAIPNHLTNLPSSSRLAHSNSLRRPAAGTAPSPRLPTSWRLVMLTLSRLRTRGSLMRSSSDFARWRYPLVSPADVRLSIALTQPVPVGASFISGFFRNCSIETLRSSLIARRHV